MRFSIDEDYSHIIGTFPMHLEYLLVQVWYLRMTVCACFKRKFFADYTHWQYQTTCSCGTDGFYIIMKNKETIKNKTKKS